MPCRGVRGATTVATGASVGPHVVAIDAAIGPGSLVGPFCYLRPGTVLEDSAKAGTFVELKNTVVGEGAKVPHLSYMGDADIGAGTNVGAGSITANLSHHPERGKSRTRIGRDVKVAVDTMFVAPVTLGDDAWTAPGTVVDQECALEPGDTILLHSDGITEARNGSREMFGLPRLRAAFERAADLSLDDLRERIMGEVRGFMAEQIDDMTLVGLRYH